MWADYSDDPALCSAIKQILLGASVVSDTGPEGIQRHPHAYLVPVAEAVRYGLGAGRNPDRHPFDDMLFRKLLETGCREPNKPNGQFADYRLAGFAINRQPNLRRLLCKTVEKEG